MNIIIDPHAGVCPGVQRAIKLADSWLDDGKSMLSLGEIIHNKREVERLFNRGLKTIAQEEFFNDKSAVHPNQTILVRSHGLSRKKFKELQDNGFDIIDATCSRVKKVQMIIARFYEKGYQIVIFGKKQHPEVTGLLGYSNDQGIVISGEKDFSEIDFTKKTLLTSQTTSDEEAFLNIAAKLSVLIKDLKIENTICKQIRNRKEHLLKFASDVDVVLFVGGKHSSNTGVLYKISQTVNPKTFWIENETEIDPDWFKSCHTIGISGSASTPLWQLSGIQDYLENLALKG